MVKASPSARAKRSQGRDASRKLILKAAAKQRVEGAAAQIRARLAEVPAGWRARYAELLRAEGLDPRLRPEAAPAAELAARRRLLPPAPVYVHYTNKHNPSLPEPRALKATLRGRHSRQGNKADCGNARAMSPRNLEFPARPNVARVKPDNLVMFTLPDGHRECVNLRWLLAVHRKMGVMAKSYQKDASGDAWAEMRVDTETRGPFRVPLWLLNQAAGLALAPGELRIQPPWETRYAGARPCTPPN